MKKNRTVGLDSKIVESVDDHIKTLPKSIIAKIDKIEKRYKKQQGLPYRICIHPTAWGDFNIIAVGKVTGLHKRIKQSQLIRSRGLGINILVIDTCDTLKDAYKMLKEMQ